MTLFTLWVILLLMGILLIIADIKTMFSLGVIPMLVGVILTGISIFGIITSCM